ncbi:MAG: AI-2E family transporter [Bacteroidaceae bacterium]|nr:AI-2E family transporter [Bacteroidaceae bacterium]MBR1754998.1 AI-2E family transporter [Bacteroidaceae bacterium]
MFKNPITFDSFIRGLVVTLIVVGAGFLLNRLSSVLLPFFIAWLLAYLMYPLVRFLQYKCRLRNRTLSILVAAVLVLAAVTGFFALVIPPTIEEFSKLSGLIEEFSERYLNGTQVAPYVKELLEQYVPHYQEKIIDLVQDKSFLDTVQSLLSRLWDFVYQTVDFAVGLVGSLIVLLYMFFILQDYESISEGWVTLIPKQNRAFATQLASDVEKGMNSYFRGQGLIAFIVGVLFSIGFLIVGMPMAIGLGMFMGLLNLVPYLQTLGFLPMALLALLKAADTGQNFWIIFGLGALVVGIVQLLQDMVLTPRIMGSAMGLNPAVILLSLSVWGSLLGFIGLIIALPLTTLLISYYRRFVLEETEVS